MQRPDKQTSGISILSRDEITEMIAEMGQPAFRSKQLSEWIYSKGAKSYDEMTNLPASLREKLAEEYPLNYPTVATRQVSEDGSRKYLLKFMDGVTVETVGMPGRDNRLSVCVSTQAGCAMGCTFCATGKAGITRNLAIGEIVNQVRAVAEDFGRRPTNVVLMGQGEPFLNYDAVMEAMRIMNSPQGLGIGARHITVSTCGILPAIRKFAGEPEQFTLAISLHSAVQKTRNRLMPGVREYTLDRLRDSITSYASVTGRRPTFEYSLIKGQNDTDIEMNALVEFCENTLCHVNLIKLNPVVGSKFKPSEEGRAEDFARALGRKGIEVTIRNSKGSDIDAACGQLKQTVSKSK